MSYALETKKRKFDRILESLTDGSTAALQSRTSLNSRNNNASTTSVSLDGSSDSSKRRRVTPSSILNSLKTSSSTSLANVYLPSSRAAFLERLETFRNVMQWHIPSTEPINASVWAKRGWTCVDTDTVACGSCKQRVRVDLNTESMPTQDDGNDAAGGEATKEERGRSPDTEDEKFALTKDVHDGLVGRYEDMVVSAHAENCPWRKRGSDASIQRIEGLLNTASAVAALKSRYDGINSPNEEIPAVTSIAESQKYFAEDELAKFQFDDGTSAPVHTNALRLAICGWQRRGEDVIECRNCFRSLGLWLYRGQEPTMDQLDAIDSHLEYCPWRQAEAQDTEISVTSQHDNDGGPIMHTKEKVPGWVLVSQAIAKDNLKKRMMTSKSLQVKQIADYSDDGVVEKEHQAVTPEQREKRMKDLMKRIKDLKKPFNVKALLRKKEKGKS